MVHIEKGLYELTNDKYIQSQKFTDKINSYLFRIGLSYESLKKAAAKGKLEIERYSFKHNFTTKDYLSDRQRENRNSDASGFFIPTRINYIDFQTSIKWSVHNFAKSLKRELNKNYLSYYKTCRRQKLMLDRKNGVEATPEQARIHFKPRKGKKEYREYKIPSQQEIEHKLNMVRINHNMSADMSQMMPKSKTFVERATINNCSIEKHQDKKFKMMTIHPESMHNKADSRQNSFRVDPMKPKTFMREQSLNYSTLSNPSNDENDELLNEKYCLLLQKPSNEFGQNLRTGDSMNATIKSNHISSFMNSLQSKSIELKSRNVDLKVPSGCSKASKPKPSYTKLVHKLGSGAKVNVDNVIDAIVKKSMIVRTYYWFKDLIHNLVLGLKKFIKIL